MKRISEIVRFVFTGGICFVIEFVVLVLLRDKIGLKTLVATPVAFFVSVIVNYFLCVRWVFTGAKEQKNSAKLSFLITSIIGLVLNELFMWIFGVSFGEDKEIIKIASFTITMYMVNKGLSTLLVMIWNYFTKRYIIRKG